MILVLEGPDESGKTTYALRLLKSGMYSAYNHNVAGASSPEYLKHTYDFYRTEGRVIFDRWWLSEMAYAPASRPMIEDIAYETLRDPSIIWEVWVKASDHSELADRYRVLAAEFDLPIIDPETQRWPQDFREDMEVGQPTTDKHSTQPLGRTMRYWAKGQETVKWIPEVTFWTPKFEEIPSMDPIRPGCTCFQCELQRKPKFEEKN